MRCVISPNFETVYASEKSDEMELKKILNGYEKDCPKIAKESNINDILKFPKERRKENKWSKRGYATILCATSFAVLLS